MVKNSILLILAAGLFSQCSADKIGENTCAVISEPIRFVNKKIKVDGIVVYDEFPMLFSAKNCGHFKREEKYISLSINYSNDDLTEHIYKSRDASSKERFGSGLVVEGVLKEYKKNGEHYYYIELQRYTKREISQF
jgi:hypothetical protein